MSPFTTELNVTFIEDSEMVKLDEPLIYTIPEDFVLAANRGLQIIVPVDFPTDLASIPQLFQSVFRKMGKHRKAAVLHDWLYHTGYYSKKYADLLFLYAMRDDGVGIVKRRMMYWAVKYGGWLAWREHRKRDNK